MSERTVEKPKDVYMFTGSFTSNIKLYKFNMNNNKCEYIKTFNDMNRSPSYIIQSRCKRYIYATLETGMCMYTCIYSLYIYCIYYYT